MSAPFSLADAAPAAAETGCCATEARTPRRPGHRVHPATHNRPSTGAQPPLHAPAPSIGLWSTIVVRYRTAVSPVRRASSAELRSIIALTQPLIARPRMPGRLPSSRSMPAGVQAAADAVRDILLP